VLNFDLAINHLPSSESNIESSASEGIANSGRHLKCGNC